MDKYGIAEFYDDGTFANTNEIVLYGVLDFAAVVIELMPSTQIDTKNGCNQCRGR